MSPSSSHALRRALTAAVSAVAIATAGLVLPPAASATSCTITGTNGPDVLTGTDGPDVICGLGGDDTLVGLGGDDRLEGGNGDDVLVGGEGDDTLIGGNQDDRLIGGDGDDVLDGGTSSDFLVGGDGDDVLDGGDAPDVLVGEAGDDTLRGGNDADRLSGGDGDDVLDGGNADDLVDGGAGNDTLVGYNGHDRLWGGPGDDRLDAGNGDDLLDAGAGDDVLVAANGHDSLDGGPGDDRLEGGNGTDVCDGRSGTDVYVGCETEQDSADEPADSVGDTDGDGLTDEREITAGTDPLSADTDTDGLRDVDEILTLTDPTTGDSDLDGVPDGAEDTDGDGLTNADEVELGTVPFRADTDGDGLEDGRETTLGTDPLVVDTDDDTLSDGDEVTLGSDPLRSDSDADGVADGDETFTRTVTDGDATFAATGAGAAVLAVGLSTAEDSLFEDVPGLASETVVVDAPAPLASGTLTLPFDASAVPADHEVGVLHFDADTGTFDVPADQHVDRATGTATVTTDHFSPFVVVDLTQWRAVWEAEIVTPREGSGGTSVDAALVLDASGSMTTNDPRGVRRDAAKAFVDSLIEGDRAAAVQFTTTARVLAALTSDKAVVKAALDRVGSSGGTDIGVAVRAGLDELDAHGLPGHDRLIVVLTDGEGPYTTSLTQRAIASDTTIYTVGLGTSIDVGLLTGIAEATGGKFFRAAAADDLVDAFDRVGGDLGAPDTDGDGIADAAETAGWRDGAGRVYRTSPTSADTDGDGLTDGDEAGLFRTDGAFGNRAYYNGFADPTRADTDGDGLGDAQELDLGTHPRIKDSDSDTINDLDEVGLGFDPLSFNADDDYYFDDDELANGTDPFGYDFDALGNVHAALSGFWFGDAWDSTVARWAEVNLDVASSPLYLGGQLASGYLVFGDVRDLIAGIAHLDAGGAIISLLGIVPAAGDALKTVGAAVKFAERSARATRAAVEVIAKVLPRKWADELLDSVSAGARLARDVAVRGLPAPRANYDIAKGGSATAKISRDAAQARALQAKLDELRSFHLNGRDVRDVRINQRQVDATGRQVGINRPDLQYTLDGKRYYLEWDKPLCGNPTMSKRGDQHAARIRANDTSARIGTTLLLLVVGACE